MLRELLPGTSISMNKGQNLGKDAPLPQPFASHSSCRWNCIMLLALMAILAMLVALTKITLDQHNPHKHLPSLLVTSTHVDSFKIQENHLTGRWNMTFLVDNGDGITGIYYDMLSATTFYEEKALAVSLVAPFHQRKNSITSLAVSFAAESWLLGEELAGKMLNCLKDGMLQFSLQFVARIRFDDGDTEPDEITISCDGMKLDRVLGSAVSSVRTLSRPWSCKVQEGLTLPLPFWLHV